MVRDNDGDGVSNRRDRCGDTPSGVAVDMHGCPKDTDGDGVADYKDYQLITPTECQPVDSLGVGMCPCPCDINMPRGTLCCVFGPEWVGFSNNSFELDSNALNSIEKFAKHMRFNPNCSVKIVGYAGKEYNNKTNKNIQASWSRVNEIFKILTTTHRIDSGRFTTRYGKLGLPYLVELNTLGSFEESDGHGRMKSAPYPKLVDYYYRRIR